MTDYDRFIDYATYDNDLIMQKRSVKGVIFNSTRYIAPLIWLMTNILDYAEHTPGHYWFYDPVMSWGISF